MSNLINLIGQEFQGCKVVKLAGRNKKGLTLWECICNCGRTVVKRTDNLRQGQTKCNVCSGRQNTFYLHKGKLMRKKYIPKPKKLIKSFPCERCGNEAIPSSKVVTIYNKIYNHLCRPCFVSLY